MIKITFEELDSLLYGIESDNDRIRAKCPAHGSKANTLSIRKVGENQYELYCYAGCTEKEICDSLGLEQCL